MQASSVRMSGYEHERAREIAATAARALAADPRVRLVYLFGSAVDPGSGVARDIDLAVWMQPALSVDELVELRAKLVEVVHAEIDLISLNDASIVLAREVADHGVCLYAASEEGETEFVVRARARFWDFKPFLDVQWENAGSRLEERLRGTTP